MTFLLVCAAGQSACGMQAIPTTKKTQIFEAFAATGGLFQTAWFHRDYKISQCLLQREKGGGHALPYCYIDILTQLQSHKFFLALILITNTSNFYFFENQFRKFMPQIWNLRNRIAFYYLFYIVIFNLL
jgi:hypothetical protein